MGSILRIRRSNNGGKNISNQSARYKPDKYRSGYEKRVAKALRDKGIEFEFEKEKIDYTIPSSKHKYIPDFKIGSIYVEAKGNFDRQSRVKMILVIEQNPDKDIRLLFMRNNKIAKNSKTTYTKWCEDRGIKSAVSSNGEIPEEWIYESKASKTIASGIDSCDSSDDGDLDTLS